MVYEVVFRRKMMRKKINFVIVIVIKYFLIALLFKLYTLSLVVDDNNKDKDIGLFKKLI